MPNPPLRDSRGTGERAPERDPPRLHDQRVVPFEDDDEAVIEEIEIDVDDLVALD